MDGTLAEVNIERTGFEDQFRVLARDTDWADRFINKGLIGILASSRPYIIEFNEQSIMIRRDSGFSPDDYAEALQFAETFLGKIEL